MKKILLYCLHDGIYLFLINSTAYFLSPDNVLGTRSAKSGATSPKDCGTSSCSRDPECL